MVTSALNLIFGVHIVITTSITLAVNVLLGKFLSF